MNYTNILDILAYFYVNWVYGISPNRIAEGAAPVKRLVLFVFALLIIALSGIYVTGEIAVAPTIGGPALEAREIDPPHEDGVPLLEAPVDETPDGSAEDDNGGSDNDADFDNNADIDGDIDDEINDDFDDEPDEPEEEPVDIVTITISAAGDTTLGGIVNGTQMFMREFEQHDRDHSHFLRNVSHIFEQDDLTILNLEGTLTDASAYVEKTYVLRGPPHFAKILSSSGVDVVNVANNHSKDFYERGYKDTIASLEAEGIAYFGNEFKTVLEINGINVGLFGLSIWTGGRDYERQITNAVKDLHEKGAQMIIAYYHWGTERSYTPAKHQRTLGRFSLDNGVDLVLGAHPHVLQGVEEYKGKFIVYSLGNFSFGANNNPSDHDTFIFQQTFTFENGDLMDTGDINIIPVRISSEKGRNNFQPTVAEGEEAERILQKIQTLSDELTIDS